jgi:hypothetical protein
MSVDERADHRSAILTMRIALVCIEAAIDFLGGSDALARIRRELEDQIEAQIHKLEAGSITPGR